MAATLKIGILTPSRGRPDRLLEMIEAIRATKQGHVEIYVGLDDDDAENYPYAQHLGLNTCIGTRRNLVRWVNLLARLALDDGCSILGSFGDDHRPRTFAWDARIKASMTAMRSGLVYCRDGLQDERLPTAPFWSADIIENLGWFYPPVLAHMYVDDYSKTLASDLGKRAYLDDVYIEHCHPGINKGVPDELNAENDAHLHADGVAYREFLRTQHPSVLVQLRSEVLC